MIRIVKKWGWLTGLGFLIGLRARARAISFPGGEQTLPEFIENLYNFAIAVVGIAIFVNFIWAGFMYLTAAGNAARTAAARQRMTNAILGAILLLSAFLILNTINPDLVKNTFNLPGVQ